MIRTQVSFDNRSTLCPKGSKVARHLARGIRASRRSRTVACAEAAPWMRYAGMVESGDPESSASIDEIVYGSSD